MGNKCYKCSLCDFNTNVKLILTHTVCNNTHIVTDYSQVLSHINILRLDTNRKQVHWGTFQRYFPSWVLFAVAPISSDSNLDRLHPEWDKDLQVTHICCQQTPVGGAVTFAYSKISI